MNRPRSIPPASQTRGHTLLEMMLSLVLLSVVMASVGSAVLFASQAVPSDDDPDVVLARDATALARIVEELSTARYVVEQGPHAVTFVVRDRTADGIPDRIRYAWSGTPGDPLTSQFNDEAPVTLLDSVATFDLGYNTQTTSRTIPGATLVSGTESLVSSFGLELLASTQSVTASNFYGQLITPSLGSEAIGFIPSRVILPARSGDATNGALWAHLYDTEGRLPGSATYGVGSVGGSEADGDEDGALSESFTWTSITLDGTAMVRDDERVALVMNAKPTATGTVAQVRTNTLGDGGLIASNDGGASYYGYLTTGLLHRLYGYEVTRGNAWTISQTHLHTIDIALQSAPTRRAALSRRVRMLLAPPVLDAFAEAGFVTDPTAMDLDADGRADWQADAAFPDSSINDGVWTCHDELTFEPDAFASADVVTVTARMRSNDALGPTIYGPNTINSAGELLPIATQLRENGAGGQELVIYNDTAMSEVNAVIPDLPAGLIDVKLTLLPKENVLAVSVRDEPVGSVKLERIPDPGDVAQAVRIGSSGGVAEFGSIHIRVGGGYQAESGDDGGGLISGVLNLLF